MSIFNTIYEIRYTRYEKGAVLLFTLIVMITLTSVVGAYLGFVQYSTRSTGAQIADSQAIYLADAGIHYGIYSLNQDSEWAGTALPASLGEGTFSVSVSDLGGGDNRLTSTGTVDGQARTVQQDVTLTIPWHRAFDYAIYGNDVSDTLDIKDNVIINGHLYYDYSSGSVAIQDNATVNHDYYIYADSVSGDGIQAPCAPDPLPTFPTLDNTPYTGAGGVITNFDSDIAEYNDDDGDKDYLGHDGAWLDDPADGVTITLTEGNLYYYADFKTKDSTITGHGTIVSNNEVKLDGTTSVSPSGGEIVIISRKKMEIKNSATVEADAVLYARGEDNKGNLKSELKVKDTATVSGSTLLSSNKVKVEGGTVSVSSLYVPSGGDKIEVKGASTTVSDSTLLSREKIEITDAATVDTDSVLYLTSEGSEIKLKDNDTSVDGSILSNSKFKMEGGATFTGIIFTSEAELKGSSTINGAVVADTYKNDEIKENVIINYNRSYFPDSIPTGLETGETTIVPKTDTWNEI